MWLLLSITESCLFALYTEKDDNIQRYCSIKFSEKCLPYVKSLTELQWYIATRDKLELTITCPCKGYRQIISPPFSIFSLPRVLLRFWCTSQTLPSHKKPYAQLIGNLKFLKLIWCPGDPKLTTGFLIISVPAL